MTTERLTAAVIGYKAWPMISGAITSLANQTEPPDHVIVVDNGSGDDLAHHVLAHFPHVTIVRNYPNEGYGAGLNAGLVAALSTHPDQVLLMAHDVLIPDGTLARLRKEMRGDPRLGAVGPTIENRSNPGIVFSAGGSLQADSYRASHPDQDAALEDVICRAPALADWLDGSFMLLRADAVRETGEFDPAYYLFYEEVDWFTRLRAIGWDVCVVPEVSISQHPGRVSGYLMYRNYLRFLWRNAPRHVQLREAGCLPSHIRHDIRRDGVRGESFRIRRRALLDFLRGRFGPPR